MVKSHEDQFQTFVSLAQSWGMDTTLMNVKLHPTLDKYFQDLNTQTSWMMFTNAYWKGVIDADTERREKGIYYV
jgi:hypothetical protein